MSLSSFAKEVIGKVLDSGITSTGKNNSVTYDIIVSDNRSDNVVMTSTFKFKNPISQSELEGKLPAFYDMLSDYLAAENLGVINAVLKKYGLSNKEFGQSKVTGSLPVNTKSSEDFTGDSLTSIRTKSGRFISVSNFRALLDITAKAYMLKHMTEGGPQLQNRTGRFINSTDIKSVIVLRTGVSNKYTLRVSYGYMKYPYETFDPAGPNSRGLANIHRNPRRIIGDAVIKAVDDLVNMVFYDLEVVQA